MSRSPLFCVFALVALFILVLDAAPVRAQGQRAQADTVLTWRTYQHTRAARIRVFASEDVDRPRTVVIDERAESAGGPVADEARYVAETVGRALGFDPAEATFVFRYTAASFTEGEQENGKVLLLRATFRRANDGDLSTPSWRLLTADGLEDLTARAMR